MVTASIWPNPTTAGADAHHLEHAAHGTLLTAALGYARAGLAVFPLRPQSKTPLIGKDAGGRGFHDATTDPNQILQWWTATPTANIGIRPPIGVLVVDVDPRAGGHTQLRRILARYGPLPQTWTARTGAGGWHHWFTLGDKTSSIRAQLARGIDLKTHDKGYLVAAPSIHPNGTTYRWTTPPQGQPAPAPAWLHRLAQLPRPLLPATSTNSAAAGHGRYSLQCLLARINAAPEGRRNTVLYGALKDALSDGNLTAFEPALAAAGHNRGLSAREIAATVASVRRSATHAGRN
ncbi:hypothetical protein C1Y40_04587 [Mycobacterium talmoniae]|uniref:DNA primase/polymerase bifunctional N-terminal domain-containing protein n=1 Tax=Mycobacterium talmoniae TaxID=1858794 RepID=A0A2S8BF24_9MYCO|nr:hypothetical protein C1Y40_04587 [Mycobacterium talmoniae]